LRRGLRDWDSVVNGDKARAPLSSDRKSGSIDPEFIRTCLAGHRCRDSFCTRITCSKHQRRAGEPFSRSDSFNARGSFRSGD
jgi:hypothetical protein